ncbi:hypothetical protein U9M48_022708 [Paspalum notatum var. saurae]|uniref:Uncharacterized protein n=1 Tax=Paspalum notatum var. saurae TaxID=547442 RepID=A0AAQ3TK58_PASNO
MAACARYTRGEGAEGEPPRTVGFGRWGPRGRVVGLVSSLARFKAGERSRNSKPRHLQVSNNNNSFLSKQSSLADGQWLAVPLLEALEQRVDVLALVDGNENLVQLLAGRPCLLAGEVHGSELLAHEPVQRVGAALGDPVRYRRRAVLDGRPCRLHRLGQRGAQLLLELGDLGEHGCLGVELRHAVGEGALHEHVAELLHQRVVSAAGVVGVGEDGLALDLLEQVLLAEASVVEPTGGVGAQRLLRHRHHAALDGALDVLLDVAQVHGLAQGDQEGGGHELQDLDGLGGLPGGDEAERVHVLVVLLRALDVVGDRVPQELQLRAIGRHGDLGALKAVVQAGVAAPGQVGGQAVVVVVVDQLRELSEHELADGSDGEAGVVHGHADGRALEVATVQGLAPGDVDERVVVDGVDLALNGLGGSTDNLNLWAEPLRRRAERIPVLLRLHQWVELAELFGQLHVGAAFEDVLHDCGGLDLSRVVLQLVGQVVGVLGLAVHDLAEHGGQHLGKDGKNVGLEEHRGGKAGAHGRAVHHGKPFLGLQLEEAALDAGDLERLSGVHLGAVRGHRHGVLAPGDEAGNVGERDEVAGRGDRATERQARRDVGVEQLDDGLEDLKADAGVALEECVDADEHGRARRLGGEDVAVGAGAEGAGVEEPDELPLERAALLGPPVRGGAEAGGDAVAVGAVHHAVHDPVAAGLDTAAGGLVQLDAGLAGAGGHGGHLGDPEAGALDLHQGLAVLGHHPLHLVEVAAHQLLRSLPPVKRVGARCRHAQGAAVGSSSDVAVLALHCSGGRGD